MLLLVTTLSMIGCSDDDKDNNYYPNPSGTYNGTLIDSKVSNVEWSCAGTERGVTLDSSTPGAFGPCTGSVTFKLGNITLGSSTSTSDKIFTPRDIAGVSRNGTGAANGVALANKIASLLISMDSDGDPKNGITITDAAVKALKNSHTSASNINSLDQNVIDGIIADTITAITTDNQAAGRAMNQVTAKEASDHQDKTAEAIESGDITPPAQIDPTASLKWVDNQSIYNTDDESLDGSDENVVIASEYYFNFATNKAEDKTEVYNQVTQNWEYFDWDDYVLYNGQWVPDNNYAFSVSTDGLIASIITGEYKINAIGSLA